MRRLLPFSAAAKGRMLLLTAIYIRLIYQTYGGSIHHRSRRLEGTGLLPRADASAASCLPIRSRWIAANPAGLCHEHGVASHSDRGVLVHAQANPPVHAAGGE